MPTDQMTEAQWLESADPFPILQWVWPQLSDRRGRLLACAACRQISHLLKDPRTTEALDVAERFADGAATADELDAAHKQANKAQNAQRRKALLFAYAAVKSASAAWQDRRFGLGLTIGALTGAVQGKVLEAEPRLGYGHLQRDRPQAFAPMADLVRHIAGNPFRDIARQTSLPTEVHELAAALYAGEDRAKALHNALQAARQSELAEHFKQKIEHPKGCWALDLILGKG